VEVVACNELVAAPCPALETQTIRSRTLSQCIMQGEAPCVGRDVCGGGEQHREGVSDLCSRLLLVCVCVCLQAPKAFKALRETKVREHCVVCLTWARLPHWWACPVSCFKALPGCRPPGLAFALCCRRTPAQLNCHPTVHACLCF